MARRRSDIAGLAALAALGYGLYNSKKKEEEARKKPAAAETPSSEPTITSDMRKRAEEEGGRLSPGEMAAMSGPAIRPEVPASSPVKTTTPRQKPEQVSLAAKYEKPKSPEPSYTRKKGATAKERAEYEPPVSRYEDTARFLARSPAPLRDPDAEIRNLSSRATEAATPENLMAGTPAGIGLKHVAGAAKNLANRTMPKAATGQTEAALKAERSAKLAEELRSAQQPTSFSSTRSAVDRNPTKSARYKEDEAGVEFKRGGKASSKPAAKGWGKARGARQAKYY
jgi:hypothetical protein